MTRIVCISDTHSRYNFELPAGDILVHGGDFSMTGELKEVEKFLEYLKSLTNFRLKIFIAGNHDITVEPEFYEKNWQRWHSKKQDYQKVQQLLRDPALVSDYGVIYLEDQEFTDPQTGLKFYGSPYQPEFCNWAFNVAHDSPRMYEIWSKIPNNVDVLITHGPPKNILDRTYDDVAAGCSVLLKRIQEVKPRLHVFGHIHEAYGREEHDSTIFVNASTCAFNYRPTQPPIVVNLEAKNTN